MEKEKSTKIKSRIVWYDRQGKPLPSDTAEEMSKVEGLLTNRGYKIVKQEKLWWGGFLSTVWLGLDHSFSIKDHKPLIFETMLFPRYRNYREIDMERYSSEEEAKLGHVAMRRKWSNPLFCLKVLIGHILYSVRYMIKNFAVRIYKFIFRKGMKQRK
jgi:hypothetical protein